MKTEAEFFREKVPTSLRRGLLRVAMAGCSRAFKQAKSRDTDFFLDAVPALRRLEVEPELSKLVLAAARVLRLPVVGGGDDGAGVEHPYHATSPLGRSPESMQSPSRVRRFSSTATSHPLRESPCSSTSTIGASSGSTGTPQSSVPPR